MSKVLPTPGAQSLEKIEGINTVLGSRLVAANIWTLSDLADPVKVRDAGTIEGISTERLQIFHEEAKLAVLNPVLTSNDLEVAVRGFGLRAPVDRQRVLELMNTWDDYISEMLRRVEVPGSFTVEDAREVLRMLT